MEGYKEDPHQIAGHEGALVDDSGLLFIKPSTQQEIDFYTKINDESFLNEEDDNLIDFTPRFIGLLESGISEQAAKTDKVTEDLKQLDLHKEKKTYLVLENLLFGFENPSVIDIKLGSVLYDDNATDEKKERLKRVSDTTTSGTHNFRVCGMKLFNDELPINDDENIKKNDDGYIIFNKIYGRNLNDNTIAKNFDIFFNHNNLDSNQRQIVIKNTFTRLQLIYNILISTKVKLISSSLLIGYENNLKRWNDLDNFDPVYRDYQEIDDDDNQVSNSLSFTSLIDFAHSSISLNYDENSIKGIENLLSIIEDFITE